MDPVKKGAIHLSIFSSHLSQRFRWAFTLAASKENMASLRGPFHQTEVQKGKTPLQKARGHSTPTAHTPCSTGTGDSHSQPAPPQPLPQSLPPTTHGPASLHGFPLHISKVLRGLKSFGAINWLFVIVSDRKDTWAGPQRVATGLLVAGAQRLVLPVTWEVRPQGWRKVLLLLPESCSYFPAAAWSTRILGSTFCEVHLEK